MTWFHVFETRKRIRETLAVLGPDVTYRDAAGRLRLEGIILTSASYVTLHRQVFQPKARRRKRV